MTETLTTRQLAGPTDFALDDLERVAYPGGEFILNRYIEKLNPLVWYYKECGCGVDIHEYIALAAVGPDPKVGKKAKEASK